MVVHNVSGDGAPTVGGLAAHGALVGALVPLVVFDGTGVIFSSSGDTIQGDLMTMTTTNMITRHPLEAAIWLWL